MKYKKIILLTIILVSLFAISAVSAQDNATSAFAGMETGSINEYGDGLIGENQAMTVDDNLTASTGTYTDLANEIANADGTLDLTRNYVYTDSDSKYKDGIAIAKEIIINGNGFSIDGKEEAIGLGVYEDNVILKNINFVNNRCFDMGSGAVRWSNYASHGVLTNCSFVNCRSGHSGGAIDWDGSYGTVSDCTFKDCYASSGAGAILWGSSDGVIRDCSFINCDAYNKGGAVYWSGLDGVIEGCNFSQCDANEGGAVYWNRAGGKLSDCRFILCSASYSGGGAVFWYGNDGVLANSSFDECSAENGGAVYWLGETGTLSGSAFVNCHVLGEYAEGGAVFVNLNSDFGTTVAGCSFINCSSSGKGGGGTIFWEGYGGYLINCTFINCSSSSLGGAVHWSEGEGVISGCTFVNCHSASEGGAVYWGYDHGKLSDCSFVNCYSASEGGAVYWGWKNGELTGSRFDECSASKGGAVYWDGHDGSLSDSTFVECSSAQGDVVYGISPTNCRFLKKAGISTSPVCVDYGEDATLTVNFAQNVGGNVVFTLNGTSKRVKITDNKANFTFSGLIGGIYDVSIYYEGNDQYADESIVTYIEVNRLHPSISADSATAKYGENATVTVNLSSDASGNVQFKIDGLTYDAPISKGIAQCTVSNLNHGSYEVIISYSGNYKYDEAQAKTTLEIDKNSPIANVAVDDVGYGHNATVIVNLARNVTGNVEIAVGNASKKAKITGNVASAAFSGLKCGKYDVEVKYAGDLNYISQNEKTSFDVVKGTPIVSVVSSDVSYGETAKITVVLKDGVNGHLNVTVNGKTESVRISDSEVICTLTGLEIGLYNVMVHYDGNDNYNPQTVEDSFNVSKAKSVLMASPVTTVYNGNKNLVVYLRDAQGNVISGATVTVVLNGKTYTPTTDKNGQVKVSTNGLAPVKTYKATITFKGNSKYDKSTTTAKVVVKKATPKLTAKAKTFKKSVKTKKYTVTLKTNQNKVMKNTKLTLKVNGKTYSAKTNAKGQATFKITKLTKKGKFTATIKYAGSKYYNAKTVTAKITVK